MSRLTKWRHLLLFIKIHFKLFEVCVIWDPFKYSWYPISRSQVFIQPGRLYVQRFERKRRMSIKLTLTTIYAQRLKESAQFTKEIIGCGPTSLVYEETSSKAGSLNRWHHDIKLHRCGRSKTSHPLDARPRTTASTREESNVGRHIDYQGRKSRR